MKITGLLFLLLIGINNLFGQNPIGLPDIVNYSRSEYSGGLQNRAIAQDKNGIVYFANSEGLLSFDGAYWKRYPLPNQTIVRSVAIAPDQKIYVGGQNELGYFSPDKNGNLVYTSLKNLLPANVSFKDVWEIVIFQSRIFFRSQRYLFKLTGKSLTSFPAYSQWQFLGLCNNQLYAEDAEKGLFHFANGKWAALALAGEAPADLYIGSLLRLNKDSILVTTLKKGLFILSGNKLSRFKFSGADPFSNQLLLCAIALDDQHIALGTQLNGLYIIDHNGSVIENLSRKEGLQNNTVLGLFLDRNHNLWMGLDNGIDFYANNSAIKRIYPERLNEGTGYSAILFNHTLYVGTSNWLYALPVNSDKDLSNIKGAFKTVDNTKGPVWGLFGLHDHLLMAHHEGAFEIKANKALPISTQAGYWNFIPDQDSTSMLAGNYNGLDRLIYQGSSFKSEGNTHFTESSRFVFVDGNHAWVAHNYKGIYKTDLTASAPGNSRLYTEKDGLPSLLKNRLFRIRNRMVLATAKGVYEYNQHTDRFEPSAYFKNTFGHMPLSYLKEDAQDDVWFISDKKLGVADFSGAVPHIIYFPELDGRLVSDFENIYPLNDENIFVGAEKGFYHINYRQYKMINNHVNVLIRAVKASGDADSVLNGGYVIQNKGSKLYRLRNSQDNLHFEYASPSYQLQSIAYSYLLKGFDKGWSAWSKRTEKDYTNLPEGHYTFQVKARSNFGNESQITGYSFIVLPPWYRTIWAYLFYGFCFIVFNYWFYHWLQAKFKREKLKYEEEQRQLNYLHHLELDKSEKEIIALKNEKLETEILGKNSELASVAMHLVQKSELLTKIREELLHLRKSANDMPSEELKKLTRILDQESKMDKDWDQFAIYFDQTQSDFLKAIKIAHPLLSAHEMKLCAYLRMNLSSKEIAQLLNISVRGVEISRYRLRKKLQIPTEKNLFNYFSEFAR